MQPFPLPNDATHKTLIKTGHLASEIFEFESVDDADDDGRRRTDDGPLVYLNSPCESSAQVR